MFSTLVLFFKTCDNLFNSGNQQERLVDNSNSISEAKKYFLGGFAEGEGEVSELLLSKSILISDLG